MKSCPTPSWSSARETFRPICAASSARTSRSTIPTPRSPRTCACWCATASRPATPIAQVKEFPGRPLRQFHPAQAAVRMGHAAVVAVALRDPGARRRRGARRAPQGPGPRETSPPRRCRRRKRRLKACSANSDRGSGLTRTRLSACSATYQKFISQKQPRKTGGFHIPFRTAARLAVSFSENGLWSPSC